MSAFDALAPVAGGGALALLIRWGYEAWRRKEAVGRVVRTMSRVYQQLHRLAPLTTAGRLMVVTCENGGGVPRPGARLYITASHEVPVRFSSLQDDWQKLPVSQSYLHEVLVPMLATGRVRIERSDPGLPELLADTYRLDGVNVSEMFSCVMTPVGWHYLVAHYDSDGPGPDELALLRKAAHRIGRLIEGRG